ncbi:MAG: hypothetical protein ACR2M7_04815 [Bdellovibrionales bacterium]
MSYLLVFILFFHLAIASETSVSKKPTICQFYLSSEKVTPNEKNLKKNLEESANIKSYSVKGKELGKEAFKRMIKDTKDNGCDGLIISGHHYGDFKDGKKKLFLKDMEKLSCDDEYKDWFSSIKSLWLLGCNTVNDNYLKTSEELQAEYEGGTVHRNKQVNSEAARIASKGDMDFRNFNLMQQSYTASINELTPLSNRYLRMFPHSKIYGFQDAAPLTTKEKNDGSIEHTDKDSSMIYNHINNIVTALNADKIEEDPEVTIVEGLNLLLKNEGDCYVDSWEKVDSSAKAVDNHDYSKVYKYGCDLIKAKQILENPKSTDPQKEKARENIIKTLKDINAKDAELKDENKSSKYSHLLFNNIYDTWDLARKKDPELYKQLKTVFKKETFSNTLKERIESPSVSSIQKVDFLNFYKEIDNLDPNKKGSFLEKHINDLVNTTNEIFEKTKDRKGLLNRRSGIEIPKETRVTLSLTVIDQLTQYGLITKDHSDKLLKNKILFPENQTELVENQTESIYSSQIKHKLANHGLDSKAIAKKTIESLNQESPDYVEQTIRINLVARDFVRNGNIEEINKIAKKLETTPHISRLGIVLYKEIKATIGENADQPKKQTQILSKYMKHNALKRYALPAADNLIPQTQYLFYKNLRESDLKGSQLEAPKREKHLQKINDAKNMSREAFIKKHW